MEFARSLLRSKTTHQAADAVLGSIRVPPKPCLERSQGYINTSAASNISSSLSSHLFGRFENSLRLLMATWTLLIPSRKVWTRESMLYCWVEAAEMFSLSFYESRKD
jgi:hypothetical protein